MAVKFKRRRRVDDEISFASTSDIAFLLLIFFMVSTIFNVEQGIPLRLPGGVSEKVKVNTKNVLTISSDASGTVFLGENAIPVHLLADEIKTRLAENERLVVSIESHPDSRYEVMIRILDEVKKSKARSISLKMRRI